MAYHYIQLRCRHVKSYFETSGWGSDEIQVGGVAIYHDFRTKLISPVTLGNFDAGDSRNVRRKIIGMSMKGGDKQWLTVYGRSFQPFYHNPGNSGIPKYFLAVLFMAERDFGGFAGWLKNGAKPIIHKKAQGVKSRVISTIKKGGYPDVPSLVASATKLTSDEENDLALCAIWAGLPGTGDDIFAVPAIVTRKITSYGYFPNGRRDTNNESKYFYENKNKSGAYYRLRVDWYKYN